MGIGTTGFYTLLLKYDRKTAITYAAILAQSEVFDFEGLLTLLRRNCRLALQPMFVPVMLMHLLLIMTMTRMQHQGQRLDHTQHSLGQHTYSSKPREDPFRADFESITPALNGTARTLSMMEMRTQARQILLEKCLTYIDVTAGNVTPDIKSLLNQRRHTIRQHLEMTRNSNQNILLQSAFEQKRIQIQLAVASRPRKFLFLRERLITSLDIPYLPTEEQPDRHRTYIRVETNSRAFAAGCYCY